MRKKVILQVSIPFLNNKLRYGELIYGSSLFNQSVPRYFTRDSAFFILDVFLFYLPGTYLSGVINLRSFEFLFEHADDWFAYDFFDW